MTLLKELNSIIKNYHYTEFVEKQILSVSVNNTDLPFCYIIIDEEMYPDTLLLSFAVDFQSAFLASELTLICKGVGKTALAEEFYIDQNGIKCFGTEAHLRFEGEAHLKEIVPISQLVH